MSYGSLREAVEDLARTGQLREISIEIDAFLELAAIQRRSWAHGGPALLFTNVKNCRFPVAANLFGTLPRARFLLRHGLRAVEQAMRLRAAPWYKPWRTVGLAWRAPHLWPRRRRHGPVLTHRCQLADLPQQVSWPLDGGPFVTLPLVYSEDPARPGWMRSNLGMYRVQLAGNEYGPQEAGLHYQIHRGIGVHHSAAVARNQDLRVNVLVGGPPALTLAAIMPLPEGMPELALAGFLAGRQLTLAGPGLPAVGEADFCIRGRVRPGRTLPEGPFGDHLGYYSLRHEFPVLEVEEVTHRPGAIWPITSVGRPPQEDTVFGELIHELTGPVIPAVLPGVHAVHAVDAAGVYPLLLAQASERYTPYSRRSRPQEILTAACAILGQGQLSLAKYLWICAREDNPALDVYDLRQFFAHMLERADWRRDLHFHTQTTIDTLDYSGQALNQGSKLVVAAVGPPVRTLLSHVPETRLDVRVVMPGVAAVQGDGKPEELSEALKGFALVSWVDDADFTAASLANWAWVTFTRSDPARDVHGFGARVVDKHWGCEGPLLIDARRKPHHAPPLVEDPAVERRIEELAAPGRALHGLF